MGGIAAVMYEPDNFEKHVRDTMVAGAGYCNEEVVRMVVSEAPQRIRELIDMGVDFDKKPDGTLDMAMEGGHTEHRILHHKDSTGAAIEQVLIQKAREHSNIQIFEDHFAIDLLTQHNLGEYVTRDWGAALCAGAGAGLYASPTDDPRDLASIETTYQPDPDRQRAYDEKYRVFLGLAEAMKPLWPTLRRLGGAAQV